MSSRESSARRRWLWLMGTGAAVAGGAYLIYRAWKEVEKREQEEAMESSQLSPSRATPSRGSNDGQQQWNGSQPASPAPAPADTMVQSMLSQEALLTPFKHRESHYTRLLAEHAAKGHIPEDELEQYRQQYGIVQQLTRMLETEPHNTPKLLHLMQLLQESGDPPPDPLTDPRLSLSPPPPH